MIIQLLHTAQWFRKHHLQTCSRLFEKMMVVFCSAHISSKAKILKTVRFPHNGIGVVVNPSAEIGEYCNINTKVTIGNGFPNGGAPKIGTHVYIGSGAFIGGRIHVADYVIIGANSVLTKDINESYVIVAGVPARIIRKITNEEKNML